MSCQDEFGQAYLRRLNIEASRMDCPNGPDRETGEWPCDPKGYFGIAECQVCGRIGVLREASNQEREPS